MQDPNIENTVPTRPNQSIEDTVPPVNLPDPAADLSGVEPTQPSVVPLPPKRPRRWPWIILGFVLIFVLGGLGTWSGYRAAEIIRQNNLKSQYDAIASKHFMAGLVAEQNKQYEIARSQYEYVIKIDPSFPDVQDRLRNVMIQMAVVNTPTPEPTPVTPTVTPTKDTRPQQDIFNQAMQEYANQNWDTVFALIDSLRSTDPNYEAVKVDGMLYTAFRFRGINKIIYQANLEGGLYDLALAEKFAPLDVDALGYRNWARLYINGASFWQIDWVKVMAYFEEIYPYIPNMRDNSGLTAIERYRLAASGQGDKLFASGDYCGAFEYYQKSLNAVPDGALEQTATAVYQKCHPATSIPTEGNTPTPTNTVLAVETTPVPVETTPVPVVTTPVPEETTPSPTETTALEPTDVPPTTAPEPTEAPPTTAPEPTEAATTPQADS